MPNKHTSPRSGDEATWLDNRDLPTHARLACQHILNGATLYIHHGAGTCHARRDGYTRYLTYKTVSKHLDAIKGRCPNARIEVTHA